MLSRISRVAKRHQNRRSVDAVDSEVRAPSIRVQIGAACRASQADRHSLSKREAALQPLQITRYLIDLNFRGNSLTMHVSPLRNLLLRDVAPRCCSEMCGLCRLCCVAPALCPAWPGPVRLTPSNPRNRRIAELPNRRGVILTESRIARRCRTIRRDSDNPGAGKPAGDARHPLRRAIGGWTAEPAGPTQKATTGPFLHCRSPGPYRNL